MFRKTICIVSLRRVSCLTALLVLAVSASAAARQPQKLTLARAVERALADNRSLAAQRHKLEATGWAVKKAYSDFLPKVSLNQRMTRVDDFSVRNANFAIEGLKSFPGFEDVDIPPLLFKDTYQTSFAVTQPLFTGGQLTRSLEIAKINRESDRLKLREDEAAIELQVTMAYFDYAKSLEFLRVQRESLALAERNLANVRSKNELGLRPKADILRWEAQVASEESRLVELENGTAVARITLANVMGAELSERFEIEIMTGGELENILRKYKSGISGSLDNLLDELYTDALRFNPGRQGVTLSRALSESAVKIARSGFYPQVNFSYNYSWQGNDTPALDGFKSWDASLVLSYSLFNGFGDVASMQKARADLKQSEYLVQDYDRALKVAVFTALNAIRTALSKIELAEKNLIQVTDNRQLVQNRYNLGLASNIDMIDAQVLESTAQGNLITARYDLLIAGAELKRIVGKSFIER